MIVELILLAAALLVFWRYKGPFTCLQNFGIFPSVREAETLVSESNFVLSVYHLGRGGI